MFGLDTPALLIILFILVLFFGKDKLPELANSVGRSMRDLKDGFEEGTKGDEVKKKNATKE